MKERKSNLELLRIVSMFLIVMHHFAIHGSAPWANHFNTEFKVTENIYLLLLSIGKASVVAFVLIGAFFLSEKKFKLWRIVSLSINTFIYSWLIFLVLKLLKINLPILKENYDIFFPIPIPSNYWFVIAYIYMLLMMPFLNIILDKCNRKQLIILLCSLFFFWCILQFFPNNKPDNIDYDFFSTNNYFLFIYLIGGYIRRYGSKMNYVKPLLLLIGSLFINELAIYLTINYNIVSYERLWGVSALINDPFGLLIGVSLFLLFKNIHINTNTFINYISKSMFGVYLIHDNSFVRIILWQRIVKTFSFADDPLKYFALALIISLCIFTICLCIDLIKRLTIDPVVMKRASKLTSKFLAWSRK